MCFMGWNDQTETKTICLTLTQTDKQTDRPTNNQFHWQCSLFIDVVLGAPINKAKLAKYRRQEFQIKDTTLSANVSNNRPICRFTN